MTTRFVVSHVQEMLAERRQIDGWLFYEYKGRNRTVLDLFAIPKEVFVSRRFFRLVFQARTRFGIDTGTGGNGYTVFTCYYLLF